MPPHVGSAVERSRNLAQVSSTAHGGEVPENPVDYDIILCIWYTYVTRMLTGVMQDGM